MKTLYMATLAPTLTTRQRFNRYGMLRCTATKKALHAQRWGTSSTGATSVAFEVCDSGVTATKPTQAGICHDGNVKWTSCPPLLWTQPRSCLDGVDVKKAYLVVWPTWCGVYGLLTPSASLRYTWCQ